MSYAVYWLKKRERWWSPVLSDASFFTCVPTAALLALVTVLSIFQGTLLRTKSKAININDLNQEDSF